MSLFVEGMKKYSSDVFWCDKINNFSNVSMKRRIVEIENAFTKWINIVDKFGDEHQIKDKNTF